ncbi:hypothetical protein ACWIG4_30240 [Streptomyces sp. NPDC002248]
MPDSLPLPDSQLDLLRVEALNRATELFRGRLDPDMTHLAASSVLKLADKFYEWLTPVSVETAQDTIRRTTGSSTPVNMRPYRLMSESGPEITVLTNNDEDRTVFRQVGWLGATGAFYGLDESPSDHERGSMAPLYFPAHSDRVETPDLASLHRGLEQLKEGLEGDFIPETFSAREVLRLMEVTSRLLRTEVNTQLDDGES